MLFEQQNDFTLAEIMNRKLTYTEFWFNTLFK